jgi:prepilin-type processing-associated H-X9-DG protein
MTCANFYLNDYGRFIPGRIANNHLSASNGSVEVWVEWLRPYYSAEKKASVENKADLLLCPSAQKRYSNKPAYSEFGEGGKPPFGAWWWPAMNNNKLVIKYQGSYGFNGWCMSSYGNLCSEISTHPFDCYWGSPQNATGMLNNIPVFADCHYYGGNPKGNEFSDITVKIRQDSGFGVYHRAGGEDNITTNGEDYGVNRFMPARHGRKINAVFLDSSVRSVELKDVYGLKWHKKYDTKTVPRTVLKRGWPDWVK